MIDPQRDIDRIYTLAQERNAAITHALETHIHNDYVTGGLELAPCHERRAVIDGDVIATNSMTFQVMHAPGHAQFHSVRRISAERPADVEVYPTHGFGSFCSATPTRGVSSTIAEQCQSNPVLTQDEQTYVDELIAGLSAYPAYYAHMGVINTEGPAPIDLSLPEPIDPEELRRRIGVDHPSGSAVGEIRTLLGDGELRSYEVSDFAGLAGATGEREVAIIGTRQHSEYTDGHIHGAVNIPLHELPHRFAEVPTGELRVHCASGYRASIAASILDRADRTVVLIDDDYNNAVETHTHDSNSVYSRDDTDLATQSTFVGLQEDGLYTGPRWSASVEA